MQDVWECWTYLFLDFSQTKARDQGQSDPEAVCDTPQPQSVSIHQIWDSYLK